MTASVAWIQVAPVKGLALESLDSVELTDEGPLGDRLFFLVDGTGRLVNAKGLGVLQQVRAAHDAANGTLELRLPQGEIVTGIMRFGEEIQAWASFWKARATVRVVIGPWGEALSDLVQRPLRLVASQRPAVDHGFDGVTSLVSTAALGALADELGVADVDGRRFRMHFGVDGTSPHAEDAWVGRRVRIGEAIVVPRGKIGRCAVTTQNPDTGRPDLDTLKAISRYRDGVETIEPLPFGVYATVERPGVVRIGDRVEAE